MSAMANTTPIVATVTKPATKEKMPKDADATPRVGLQRKSQEKENKRRLSKLKCQDLVRKVIQGRAYSTDLVILTRQEQLNPDQKGKTPGIVLIVEAALTGGTLLTKIVLGVETAPATLKNHMIIPGAAPDMEDTGSQSQKGTSLRMRMTWRCPGYVKRAARVWFDELPPESIDGYKDLKAAFLAYFMQQKKHVKVPIEIHNIKQRDEETIEESMERFKVETRRIKGAPECMRISEFMHGVNNPELTKRLNEHVPKTMEEMMIATTAFIRGEAAAAGKKKGHASWRAQDQSKRHASERSGKVQTATTYGNPGGEEKQEQVLRRDGNKTRTRRRPDPHTRIDRGIPKLTGDVDGDGESPNYEIGDGAGMGIA
ncbi:reverse transcriptase domain-containing protein [Tanacetum coccineum]